MSNIFTLPGVSVPTALGKPNEALIGALKKLAEMAEEGRLQSFIGTGYTSDGLRVTTFAGPHQNVQEMLGALVWLQHEYVARVTGGKEPDDPGSAA